MHDLSQRWWPTAFHRGLGPVTGQTLEVLQTTGSLDSRWETLPSLPNVTASCKSRWEGRSLGIKETEQLTVVWS